jgi:rRNA maturation protein Nop10
MTRGFHIEKLSDEFGQYTLALKCSACGHERAADICHTDVATN